MDFVNAFATMPEALPHKPPTFEQACNIYRDAKASGNYIPDQVVGIIAVHVKEHGLDLDQTLYEAQSGAFETDD